MGERNGTVPTEQALSIFLTRYRNSRLDVLEELMNWCPEYRQLVKLKLSWADCDGGGGFQEIFTVLVQWSGKHYYNIS